ncbi:MAG: TrfB-related DNA-binding protein [Gammaproteobacteria bacterium]|nr:TrfB-related DNA-binding protein [Gammaproteobacteria bacterium]
MAKKKYLKLTNLQFEKAVQHVRLFTSTKEACRLVLVDGLNPTQAANKSGVLRQTIAHTSAKIEEAVTEHKIYSPPGTRWIHVCVPENIAEVVEASALDTRATY